MVLGLLLGLELWVDQWEVADTPTPASNPKEGHDDRGHSLTPVSYTHLTLPTNREV